MDLTYLRNILSDLKLRFDSKYSSNAFQLKRELLLLNRNEKSLIKKKVLQFDYNVGGLKVLKVLKEAGVVSLTEYLNNITDEGEVQGIIGDVLDCEDPQMQDMLAEVIMRSKSSAVIDLQFRESFRQYTLDMVTRSELIQNEFISNIEPKLLPDVFRDSIVSQFINELLMHEFQKTSDLKQVFSSQKDWNRQFTNESFGLLSRVLRHVSLNHSDAIVNLLLTKLQTQVDLNCNWFLGLFILKHINQNSKEKLKKFLKSLFHKFQETDNVEHLLEMMIIARQLYHYSSDMISYKSWVKTTFGEVHYYLKSQSAFTRTLEALQAAVFFETDLEILEAHVQTAITSPRGKNHLVLEYKQLLRAHIASLGPAVQMDLT